MRGGVAFVETIEDWGNVDSAFVALLCGVGLVGGFRSACGFVRK